MSPGSRRLFGALLAAGVLVGACAQINGATAPPTTPAATGTPGGGGQACTASDLGIAGGPSSGGAGSRGAEVRVENRSTGACILPPQPTVAITDAAGTPLLEGSAEDGGDADLPLEAGSAVTFFVEYSNWCDETVGLPLYFVLVLDDGAAPIEGLSAATRDDLPPCNGPGQPPSLTTTVWQPGA